MIHFIISRKFEDKMFLDTIHGPPYLPLDAVNPSNHLSINLEPLATSHMPKPLEIDQFPVSGFTKPPLYPELIPSPPSTIYQPLLPPLLRHNSEFSGRL